MVSFRSAHHYRGGGRRYRIWWNTAIKPQRLPMMMMILGVCVYVCVDTDKSRDLNTTDTAVRRPTASYVNPIVSDERFPFRGGINEQRLTFQWTQQQLIISR